MPSSAGTSAPARITTTTRHDPRTRPSRAAPELRPRRGSQQRLARGVSSRLAGSAGTSAPARITTATITPASAWRSSSAGASAPARITTSPRSSVALRRRPWQRRDFGPGEDHNTAGRRPAREPLGSSAGTSAPARITTLDAAEPIVTQLPRQRRDFGPGEDHNIDWLHAMQPRRCGQRRDFGPGEDHNSQTPAPCRQRRRAAPGLRPRRGSQRARSARPPDVALAAPELRPRRGSQLDQLRQRPTRTWQRRGFSPGEDHNPAIVDTVMMALAAPGLRPRRGSQLAGRRLANRHRRTAPGPQPRRGAQPRLRQRPGLPAAMPGLRRWVIRDNCPLPLITRRPSPRARPGPGALACDFRR